MFDFTQMDSHSTNAALDLGYSERGTYKNDEAVLKRADTALAYVKYRIPAGYSMSSIKVYALKNSAAYANLILQVATGDGAPYTTLTPTITENLPYQVYDVPSLAGGNTILKVMITEATTSAWPVLGRVEIAYAP